jgi:hypothetical protein
MAPDQRIRDRIDKLLRLGAPQSGTTEAERISALQEAARLVAEHDISFSAEPEERPRAKNGSKPVSRNTWMLSVALDHCSCSHCHGLISPRDIIWLRVRADNTIEYRHKYQPCTVE